MHGLRIAACSVPASSHRHCCLLSSKLSPGHACLGLNGRMMHAEELQLYVCACLLLQSGRARAAVVACSVRELETCWMRACCWCCRQALHAPPTVVSSHVSMLHRNGRGTPGTVRVTARGCAHQQPLAGDLEIPESSSDHVDHSWRRVIAEATNSHITCWTPCHNPEHRAEHGL